MADKIMVRPGPGRTVRLMNGRRLTTENTPAEGVAVEVNTYINRRLACDDLVIVQPAPPAAAAIAKPAATNPSAGA